MADRASVGNSTLRLLGCGCALLVIVVAGSVVAFTYFAYSQAQQLAQGFTDPEARAAKTREILHYETLPEGYFPAGGMSLPVVFKTAVLTDKRELSAQVEGEEPDRFDRRGFFYVELPGFGRRGGDVDDYFEEGGNDDQVAVEVGDEDTGFDIGFDVEEILDRGEVPIRSGKARYVARRGTLEVEGEELPGLSTVVHLECDTDSRVRFGLWFTALEEETPPVTPEAPEGTDDSSASPPFDPTGTPADSRALEDFLGHFEFCD